MTVVNPKSISGINSITMASGSDNLLTIHANDTSEKVRVNNSGDVIVGSGVTLSPDGDIFATGITTSTTFVGALTGNVTGNVTGNISGGTVAGSTGTFTGAVTDSKGDVRSIPANSQSGAYVAVAADAGKAIYISTGGVTINDSVFSAGNAVTIINNSGSNQTITQGSGVTLYNAADATTGNRTLAGRGMSTIWFISASVAYISGAGLS